MKLTEELNSIKSKVPNWETTQRQNTLEYTIATIVSTEPTLEELLENNHDISKSALHKKIHTQPNEERNNKIYKINT